MFFDGSIFYPIISDGYNHQLSFATLLLYIWQMSRRLDVLCRNLKIMILLTTLLTLLYVRVGNLLTCGKHLHDHIISLRAHTISFIQPHLIEKPVPSQECMWPFMCVLWGIIVVSGFTSHMPNWCQVAKYFNQSTYIFVSGRQFVLRICINIINIALRNERDTNVVLPFYSFNPVVSINTKYNVQR